ncbi:MAG: NADH-quinone oxidoreductase subunit J [Anaerolineae bacterium]|nr:NADH-quinone oxidoreductase subunit J [Anaerolineae bacterium]
MELTLFIIVGAVAVMAAAMMLVSENAVHSALFLILNFACIAFFFLMLQAPFLAMVQITVYAGAIMVLFLFVIMLLGAERLLPEKKPRFPWLTPVAMILALVFLVTVSVALIGGEIDLTAPQKETPQVRVIHALDGVAAVDVYVGEKPAARDLAYEDHTDFGAYDPGEYAVRLLAAGTDTLLSETEITLAKNDAVSLVAVGPQQTPALVAAYEDMTAPDDSGTLRVVAINALHDRAPVVIRDVTRGAQQNILIENLPYGAASDAIEINEGTYSIGVFPPGDAKNRLQGIDDTELDADTSVLWIFAAERMPDNSFDDRVLEFKTDAQASFGSPTHIGRLLFSRYVLPFEMVALVLLVAMIGAIVLTHETKTPRRRMVRRLANPPAGLDQPVTGEPGK